MQQQTAQQTTCNPQLNQQPPIPSAPADLDSSKEETSYLGDFYRWSRESKTIKTESQFKVSYHQERRIGTANWALFSSKEETVKYTEVQNAKKNRKRKKYWQQQIKSLAWALATLLLIGSIYSQTNMYQQA